MLRESKSRVSGLKRLIAGLISALIVLVAIGCGALAHNPANAEFEGLESKSLKIEDTIMFVNNSSSIFDGALVVVHDKDNEARCYISVGFRGPTGVHCLEQDLR
jgi:hypothetical protein